jgi:DNA modification methylase
MKKDNEQQKTGQTRSGTLFLSDNEKRDIVKYLEAGKPLPEKYRFLLFKDDREVELVWNGKSNEVTNVVLPFQVIEQIDEPREGKEFGDRGTLFDFSGKQITGWTNKLIWGDNKLILSSLKNGPMRKEIEAQGGLKLVYIDPPFDVGADFAMDIEIGGGGDAESFTKKPSVIEEIAYRDTWGKGADSFIAMIYERLKLIHELLAEDGSIYVHCDWRLSGHTRLVLDEIFGKDNFVNEIIWAYFGPGTDKSKEFTKKHDTIFYFAKNKGKHIFNDKDIRVEHSEKTKDNYKKGLAGSGFSAESINDREKEVYAEDTNLNKLGKIPEDWWEMAIAARYPVDGIKRTGYPTEKPLPLLERIIKASSKEGDLIADFFLWFRDYTCCCRKTWS